MTKQKIDKNYLDYIPVKNPDIEYETMKKELSLFLSAGKVSSIRLLRNFFTAQK